MKRLNLKLHRFKKPLLLICALTILLTITFFKIQDTSPPDSSQSQKQINPGSIQVIRQIARDIFEKCNDSQAICYEERVQNELLGVYATPEILKAVYDYDTYFSCHAFTHFLGRALYRELKSIPEAYSQVDFTCHGGSYHGVLEAYLEESKTTVDELSGKYLEEICRESPKKSKKSENQIFTECLHGFGHAFMFITNSDLPKSLNYCDKLDPTYQERCWGGAFMENSTSSTNKDHPTQWLDADDKFYPCTILAAHYLKQCYFYQANYLLKITSRDYRRVFADCGQVRDPGNHDYCILGLGAQLASVSNEQGIDVAASVCQMAAENNSLGDAYVCIEGAVPSLFTRYGGDAPQIFEFCNKVTPFLREFCFAKLGSVAKTYWEYNLSRLEDICNQAKQFKNACLNNANIQFKY